MNYYFDLSLVGWAIKDSSSHYVYANRRACECFNIPTDTIIGKSDADLIPDIGEFHRYILSDDKKIINTQNMSVAFKVFDYGGRNHLKAYLVEKRPWMLSDGTEGIACSYIELTNVFFSSFLSSLRRRPLVFTKPTDLFTDRDWEVIILLLCGMKRRAISDILGISHISLRNRIIRCCQKAGVLNTTSLLAYCHINGWDNYIPPFFLKKKHMVVF